jgi:hypothetical protein
MAPDVRAEAALRADMEYRRMQEGTYTIQVWAPTQASLR